MGVLYLSPRNNAFEDLYIKVRIKEQRVFTDEQVLALPELDKNHRLYNEWQLRKKSAKRFIGYLKNKNCPLKILDIGCGNGWFSHLMSNVRDTDVTALDLNSKELEQAGKVFKKPSLKFVYANVFEIREKFDLIVFNASFQYFRDIQRLIETVSGLLNDDGEIHIIDTPFYNTRQLANAKARTRSYYENLGFGEMSANYFHHSWDDLARFKFRHKPSLFAKLLRNDSPFCWISIDKI